MAIIYVGLDVHKETIAVALAEAGKRSEVLEHGKIANTLSASAAKLARGGHELRFCYEAGHALRHSAAPDRSKARMRRRRPVADRTLRQTRDPRMGRLIQSPDGGSNQSETYLPPRRKPRYYDQIEILGLTQ